MSEPNDDEKKSASIVYVAGPGDPISVEWGGHTFVSGQAVTVTNPDIIARASTNPAFNVDGEDKAADAQKAAEDRQAEEEDAQLAGLQNEAKAMEARHKQEQDTLAAQQASEADALDVRGQTLHDRVTARRNSAPKNAAPLGNPNADPQPGEAKRGGPPAPAGAGDQSETRPELVKLFPSNDPPIRADAAAAGAAQANDPQRAPPAQV